MKIDFSVLLFCAPLLAFSGVSAAQNAYAPDNSGVNVRDRSSAAMTADQQSQDKKDVELTSQIRRAVEKDDHLSVMAKNVKIIAADGRVILRGPVKTTAEERIIAHKAEVIAGADQVTNQLQVKGQ